MAAGLNANMTAQSFNQTFGSVYANLFQALDQVNQLHTWIAANGAAGIEALPAATGGAQIVVADANTIVSTDTDGFKLYQIFHGIATQAATYDFTTFSKLVIGLGVH